MAQLPPADFSHWSEFNHSSSIVYSFCDSNHAPSSFVLTDLSISPPPDVPLLLSSSSLFRPPHQLCAPKAFGGSPDRPGRSVGLAHVPCGDFPARLGTGGNTESPDEVELRSVVRFHRLDRDGPCRGHRRATFALPVLATLLRCAKSELIRRAPIDGFSFAPILNCGFLVRGRVVRAIASQVTFSSRVSRGRCVAGCPRQSALISLLSAFICCRHHNPSDSAAACGIEAFQAVRLVLLFCSLSLFSGCASLRRVCLPVSPVLASRPPRRAL